jgi:hypothetical protein
MGLHGRLQTRALVWASLLGGLPGTAHAQEPAVRVQYLGEPRVELGAERVGTFAFRVVNTGRDTLAAQPQVVVPAGWQLLTPDAPLALAPGESALRLISVARPRNAAAGVYTVRFGVPAPADASDSARVEVRPRRQLSLERIQAPLFAVAGRPYPLEFRLHNAGNSAEQVRLTFRSSHPGPVRIDSSSLLLAPGESRPVRLTVSPPQANTAYQHWLELRAVSSEDTAAGERVRSTVDVIPRAVAAPSRYHSFPLELRLRSGNVRGGATTPVLSGSGVLVPNGATRIDLVLRGADRRPSGYVESPEYRVGIVRPGLDVQLGHQFYALSPLSETGRLGFGVGARAWGTRWRAGAFAGREPGGTGNLEYRAASLGAEWGAAAADLQMVSRRGRDTADVATLRTALTPLPGHTADLEYGRALDRPAAALSLQLSGRVSEFGYHLRHLRADSSYPASGMRRLDDLRLEFRTSGDLRIGAEFRQSEAASAGYITAWRANSQRATVGYGSLLSAELIREERALHGGAASESQSVRLRGSYALGPVWLYPGGEIGTARAARTVGTRLPFRRVSLHSTLRSGFGSLSTSLEHSTANDPLSSGGASGLSLAASVSAKLTRGTLLRVSGRQAQMGRSGRGGVEFLDLSLEQRLARAHRLIARMQTSRSAFGRTGPSLMLDYVAPLGVPIGRRRDVSQVSGRIFSAATGQGVADVRVRLGDRITLTDAAGRWRIVGVKPGVHEVEIDRLSLGAGQVPDRPLPLRVAVAPGGTERLDVGLVEAGRIMGSIVLPPATGDTRGPTSATAPPDLGGAVVQLSRPGESHRLLTDRHGGFSFPQVRPGRWTLRVEGLSLPPHHHVERDSLEVEVGGGDTATVRVRVLAKARPILLVARGEILVAPGTKPSPSAGVHPPPPSGSGGVRSVRRSPPTPKIRSGRP